MNWLFPSFFLLIFPVFLVLIATPKIIREVTVKIIDRGIGISEEDRVGLFNAYSQVRPEQLQQGE